MPIRSAAELLVGSALARRWAVAVVVISISVVAGLATALSSMERWVGWFPTLISTFESSIVWLPSVFCAFACWIAGQARAHGMRDWVTASPRSPAMRIAPTLVLVAIVASLSLVLVLTTLAATSVFFGLRSASPGSGLLLSIPTVFAYVLFWVGVGAFLGRSLRREIALPICAVVPYAVWAVMTLSLSDAPVAALAVGDARSFDYVRPSDAILWTRASFWVLLTSAVWLRLLDRPRPGRVFAWGSSAAAALAIFQGAAYIDIPQATRAVCEGDRPTLCVDGAHASVIPRYREAVAAMWPSLPAPLRPMTVASDAQVGAAASGRALVVPPVAGYSAPALVVDRQAFFALFGSVLFMNQCTDGDAGLDSAWSLTVWWRQKHGIPIDRAAFIGDAPLTAVDADLGEHQRVAREFSRLPVSAQEAWFRSNADSVRACMAPALPGSPSS